MKIQMVGYTDQYKEGVLHCLKRNYKNMENMTDEALYDWAKPFLTYEWELQLPEKCQEFKHGVVLLDGDKVVGYLGFIFSQRNYKGEKYIYQNGTTWAIDDGYRIYMFSILKKIYKMADVLADITPNPPSVVTLTKLFKFKQADEKFYKFYPVPLVGGVLHLRPVESYLDIEDFECAISFKDMCRYGVKCIEIIQPDTNKPFYIFYRCTPRKFKKVFTLKWITILSASDWEALAKYAHEIIWYLQKHEKGFVECDGRFISEENLKGCKYVTRKCIRLVKGMPDEDFKLDLLYTELAMLDYSKV